MDVMLKGRKKIGGTAVEVDLDSLLPDDSGPPAEVSIEDVHYIGAANEPIWEHGWHNYNAATYAPAGFYKDRNRVFLMGIIDGGVFGSAFTLPSGYTPEFIITIGGNDTDFVWLINPAGLVVPKLRNSPYGMSLEGISFRVV